MMKPNWVFRIISKIPAFVAVRSGEGVIVSSALKAEDEWRRQLCGGSGRWRRRECLLAAFYGGAVAGAGTPVPDIRVPEGGAASASLSPCSHPLELGIHAC